MYSDYKLDMILSIALRNKCLRFKEPHIHIWTQGTTICDSSLLLYWKHSAELYKYLVFCRVLYTWRSMDHINIIMFSGNINATLSSDTQHCRAKDLFTVNFHIILATLTEMMLLENWNNLGMTFAIHNNIIVLGLKVY